MISTLEKDYIIPIFEAIHDGIIIMDEERTIRMINPAGRKMTGWKVNGQVPVCSVCEKQESQGMENCYLAHNNDISFLQAKMPTIYGEYIDVEMSTTLIDTNTSEKEYLLVLRNQSEKKQAEELIQSKLMIQKLMEAKEAEHKRLAQELHDGIGQSLYSISIALQAIETYVQEERLNTYIQEVREELDQTMNDVISYSHQLRPPSIDKLGLLPTVHTLLDYVQMENPEMIIVLNSNLTERLPSFIEINLYRVIQEAVQNVMKYARASRLLLYFVKDDLGLKLKIEDNGIGFHKEQVWKKGLGLKHMEERINLLKGKFSISSSPIRGTEIQVMIPLEDYSDD